MARVTNKSLTLIDSKTGAMDLKIQERKLAGHKSPELAALLKTKSKTFDSNLDSTHWHSITVRGVGDTMTALLDDKEIGSFQSEGIAHSTERMITLAVNNPAKVDAVKVSELLP